MSRPKFCRKIGCVPDANYFKPRGVPSAELDEVVLTLDEFEALRLADLEGLYQEEAAARMEVSRQTFGRIIDSAHRKIADVLINARALRIAGGTVAVEGAEHVRCPRCRNALGQQSKGGGTQVCPRCRHESK
jgi:predicted DNA-binding protein (UPF0251 family)